MIKERVVPSTLHNVFILLSMPKKAAPTSEENQLSSS
jgi:hypothetical protein